MRTKISALLLVSITFATVTGCSTAPPRQPAVEAETREDDFDSNWQAAMLGTLNFRDFTDRSMLVGLTIAQRETLLSQAIQAYEEERRWFIFMVGPSDDAIVPAQSPLRDWPWDEAITKEIRSMHMSVYFKIMTLRMLRKMNTGESLLIETELVAAALDIDSVVTARRKLSRDILEEVYDMNQHVTTFYDFDLLYKAPKRGWPGRSKPGTSGNSQGPDPALNSGSPRQG